MQGSLQLDNDIQYSNEILYPEESIVASLFINCELMSMHSSTGSSRSSAMTFSASNSSSSGGNVEKIGTLVYMHVSTQNVRGDS
jgi:hypothetical protein